MPRLNMTRGPIALTGPTGYPLVLRDGAEVSELEWSHVTSSLSRYPAVREALDTGSLRPVPTVEEMVQAELRAIGPDDDTAPIDVSEPDFELVDESKSKRRRRSRD